MVYHQVLFDRGHARTWPLLREHARTTAQVSAKQPAVMFKRGCRVLEAQARQERQQQRSEVWLPHLWAASSWHEVMMYLYRTHALAITGLMLCARIPPGHFDCWLHCERRRNSPEE